MDEFLSNGQIIGEKGVGISATHRKSFTDITYNNTKNTTASCQPMLCGLKIYPLDKYAAAEGFSEMFSQWTNWKS